MRPPGRMRAAALAPALLAVNVAACSSGPGQELRAMASRAATAAMVSRARADDQVFGPFTVRTLQGVADQVKQGAGEICSDRRLPSTIRRRAIAAAGALTQALDSALAAAQQAGPDALRTPAARLNALGREFSTLAESASRASRP